MNRIKTSISFPESSGHYSVSAQEQLFDKLIKQTLAYRNKNLEFHLL